MFARRIVLLSSVCLPAPAALAGGSLTWDACMLEAREHNPSLRAARLQLDTVRLRRWSAAGAFLPTLGVSASADAAGEPGTGERSLPKFATHLSLSQSLFSGFAKMADADRAEAAARQEESRYRATEARTRHEVRQAFTETLFRQGDRTLREEIAARWKRNAELVVARVSASKEEASSLEQAQAEVTKAEFEVARAGRAVLRARQKLSRAMGRERFESFEVAGTWDAAAPPVNPDLDRLVDLTPEVQEAFAALDEQRAALREAGAPFWPSVEASIGLSRDGSAWPPAEGRGWSTGVAVSYNLFNGLRDRVNLAAARNAAEASKEELLIARREALGSFEEALSPYTDAYEAVNVRRQSRDAARARADTARTHYEAGESGFDQWHEVEQGLIEAETEFLAAQREALDAESGWRRAIGEGFGGAQP